MKEKLSQAFLIISIIILVAVIIWLVSPNPYRVCHFVLTGMGRARSYPYEAKFKPYKGKMMGGFAIMNSVIKEQIASFSADQEPYCFLSLGAELSGTAEAFLTKGRVVAKAFNAMKLDAMLVGNIDFTFGKETLLELSKSNSFKFLSSNVLEDKTNKTPEYFIDELIIDSPYDLKIGVLGLTPPDTPNLATKESISGLKFLKGSEVLKNKVDSLRGKGADLVALLTQYNKEYIRPDEWLEIASASPDICFMLDSDIEAPVPFVKDGVIVYTISSYNQTKEIDILNLAITKKRPIEIVGLSANRIATNLAEYDRDTEVETILDNETANIRAFRDKVIGRFAKDYSKSYYTECPIGDYITDIFLKETKADIAMQNSGSIHGNVNEGKFTNGDLYSIMPFSNKIVLMDLKGSDILELLNISASRKRGILQVSGLEYSYYYKNQNDYKLICAKINGEGIKTDKTYRVATNNFLAEGGDNYLPFTKGENVVFGRPQREVIREYVASQSIIAPIELKIDGRIKIQE